MLQPPRNPRPEPTPAVSSRAWLMPALATVGLPSMGALTDRFGGRVMFPLLPARAAGPRHRSVRHGHGRYGDQRAQHRQAGRGAGRPDPVPDHRRGPGHLRGRGHAGPARRPGPYGAHGASAHPAGRQAAARDHLAGRRCTRWPSAGTSPSPCTCPRTSGTATASPGPTRRTTWPASYCSRWRCGRSAAGSRTGSARCRCWRAHRRWSSPGPWCSRVQPQLGPARRVALHPPAHFGRVGGPPPGTGAGRETGQRSYVQRTSRVYVSYGVRPDISRRTRRNPSTAVGR